MLTTDALYFGCGRDVGHYFWTLEGDRHYNMGRAPFGGWEGEYVDGKYAPSEVEGHAAMFRRNGWTMIAFADRSVDKRPGSNSAFMFKGELTFPQMLELAERHFPMQWARLKTPPFAPRPKPTPQQMAADYEKRGTT